MLCICPPPRPSNFPAIQFGNHHHPSFSSSSSSPPPPAPAPAALLLKTVLYTLATLPNALCLTLTFLSF
jgi:hypothetical protein